MKKLLFLILSLCWAWHGANSQTDVPRIINYVGVLADANGKPLNDKQTLTFSFADKNGRPILSMQWTETWDDVPLTGGMFSVALGSKMPLPRDLDSVSNIAVTVKGVANPIIIKLYSAPFALNVADESITERKLRPNSITPEKFKTPLPQGGSDQVIVFNGDKLLWEYQTKDNSVVKTINGLHGDFRFDDEQNYITARADATTNPRELQLQFNYVREVGDDGNIELGDSEKSSDGKGRKLTAKLKSVPLKTLKQDGATTGDLMQFDESVGGWIPADPQYLMPVGSVIAFAGNFDKIPKKWLPCDGRALRNIDFPKLSGVLGSAYGSDGVTFRIPDMRGRFLRGVDDTRQSAGEGSGQVLITNTNYDPDRLTRRADTIGLGGRYANANRGNMVGSVQEDEFKSHRHSVSETAMTHWGYGGSSGGQPDREPAGYNTDFTGGSETRPTNIAVVYIIKVLP